MFPWPRLLHGAIESDEKMAAGLAGPGYHINRSNLICGVDASGGGAAWSVVAFRRGTDARSIPRIRIPAEHTRGGC